MSTANILAKFSAQFTQMKQNDFITGNGIGAPVKKSRRWAVNPASTVYPITMLLQSRFTAKNAVVTDETWVFIEELAHLMTAVFWQEQGLTHPHLPVYVQFTQPITDDDGSLLYGFVVGGESIVCIDPAGKNTPRNKALVAQVKLPLRNLGKPATNMMQPIHHVVEFNSSSSPTAKYRTTVWKDGSVSCNCLGWTRSKKRGCKHVNSSEVKAILDVMI